MLKDTNKVWDVINEYDIRPITVRLRHYQNLDMRVGLTEESEEITIGPPFQFMYSPPFLRFIDNINRVMTFYPQAIKDFNIKTTPIDLKIIYDRQVFLIFLINSLEVYLSSTFEIITNILRVDDPNSEFIIKFIKKYGSIEKYNDYFEEEKETAFVSRFLTKRISFQQKDVCRECFRFVDIYLPGLDSKLWQKIYSKKDGYMQLRHNIIHGDRPSVKEINEIYGINSLESALFDIVRFVYLIEEQRFFKYKTIEEHSDIIQSLRKNKGK